jgi:small ligand-binding sensory domain FIST
MRFLSFISDEPDWKCATDVVIGDVALRLKGRPDVVFVFISGEHVGKAAEVGARIYEQLEPEVLIGVTAEGVIGFDREVERRSAVAVMAGQWPGVRMKPFHVGAEEWRDLLTDSDALRERMGYGEESRAIVAFGDPFTTPTRQMLAVVNETMPGAPIVGGMASAAREPLGNALLLNGEAHVEGLVGVTIAGPVSVETVVSQGCRPIGNRFVITRAKENQIEQLGGRPALEVLAETLHALPEADQQLLRSGLFLGRVINEYREDFTRGDFLIRNVIGMDQEKGSLAVTDYVRPGQTVQFQVRDAASATEDLMDLLGPQQYDPPAGALLFSCNGRGTRLFPQPCHDIGAAKRIMPATPVAGFFAAGELGPVGNQNFIHGHTASFAMFRPIKT